MCNLIRKSGFIMVGMPGSGKSTLAKKLCQRFDCEYFSSDRFREELLEQCRYETSNCSTLQEARELAYKLMYENAAKCLTNGGKVVIDATHLDTQKRRKALGEMLEMVDPNNLCFVLVNPKKEDIKMRMYLLEDQINTENESLYEGWKRVYDYFLKQEKLGNYSWPRKDNIIESIEYQQLESILA